MASKVENTMGERLRLHSSIAELSQVSAWVERLASRYPISTDSQFAMDLCLEEVISNIIRHGYRGQPDHSITVDFANTSEGNYVFVVEDEANAFDPLDAPLLPALSSVDDIHVGGQGIRLLREFADTLEYQRTPIGNRLIMGFSSYNHRTVAEG